MSNLPQRVCSPCTSRLTEIKFPDGTVKNAAVRKHIDAFTWSDKECDDCVVALLTTHLGHEPTNAQLWSYKVLAVQNLQPRVGPGEIGPTADTLRKLLGGVAA